MPAAHVPPRAGNTYLTQGVSARAIACVVLMHLCIFAWLSARMPQTTPAALPVLMAQLIAPTALPMAAPQPRPAPPAPKPRQPVTPRPPVRTLVVQSPAPAAQQESIPVATAPAAPQPAAQPATAQAAPPVPAVIPARFDAGYLQNPAPVYPPVSRRLGEKGRVLLRVFVEISGLPSRIEIRTGSGSNRLDQAAQEAVQRWKFIPARQGSDTVAAWVLVPIVFNLRG